MSRQLAAIMFTDIAGYTALMGKDESRAFDLLKKNRQVQRPIIEHFNGRWLKEIGDGVLASFSSVSDAVYCAAHIQKACESHEDLNLRIGIHLGEVVFEGDDVFGDGVNIASRLEPLAPVGGILVSESVQNNLLNKSNIQSSYLGEEQLKNVRRPVKIYQIEVGPLNPITANQDHSKKASNRTILSKYKYLAWGLLLLSAAIIGGYYLWPGQSVQSPKDLPHPLDKSIVVLPFADMSANKDQEYFSDGMMEEILNHLVKIEDIKVVSRTTAMKYKGSNKSTKEIAQELGVATVLEGSVRKEGEQVRITVQLIDGNSDLHLFSESYDRQLTSVFEVQSEVAEMVAQALQAQISPEVRLRIEEIPTSNSKAYEFYLRGRNQYSLFWSGSLDATLIDKGVEYYNQAISLDPEFSNAYAGLGQAYWMLAHFSPDYHPSYWELSKSNLLKAIELDPGNGWAYAELGVVQHNWNWDLPAALKSFQKAVQLNPTDPEIHNHFMFYYQRTGECDKLESESRIRNALQNQDYQPDKDLNLLFCRRDMDQISRLDPTKYPFEVLMFQEKYQEVITRLNDSTPAPGNYYPLIMLGEAYALLGDSSGARGVLDQIDRMSVTQYVPASFRVPIHLALGEEERAFQLLEQALEQREMQIHILTRFFISVYKIQDHPRFVDIIRRSWIPQE